VQLFPETQFLFKCSVHDMLLEGRPGLVHPTPEAVAVWVFDTSDMTCPKLKNTDPPHMCHTKWQILINQQPQ
jgi:hypothetical protein